MRGRLADDLAERPAEGPEAGEADIEADVGDAAVGLAQEEHRALDSSPLQVPVGRLPEDGAEAAAEMRFGDMRHGGHGTDIERLGVGAVHGIAGAKEAPVHVLDFPAHRTTLRHHRALYHPRMDSLLIILIVVLVLVVMWRGPKNLPKLGEALGRGVKEAKIEATKAQAEIQARASDGTPPSDTSGDKPA